MGNPARWFLRFFILPIERKLAELERRIEFATRQTEDLERRAKALDALDRSEHDFR